MIDPPAIVRALEKLGFIGPRIPGLNPTWGAALGGPSLPARAFGAVQKGTTGAANKAISGVGYLAGLPLRPVRALAGAGAKGGLWVGAQGAQGLAKRVLGFAGRNPVATAGNLALLGLGGLGVNMAASKAGGRQVNQTAGMFLKGASVTNLREQHLRKQSEAFVKTAAGPFGNILKGVSRAVGGAATAAKAARPPSLPKARAPKDFASIATTLAALTAFGGAMGTGLRVADAAVDAVADKALRGNKQHQYVAMLKEDPELAAHPEAKRYFNMLYRASNYVSSEPVLAAGAVRSMVNQPTPDFDGRQAKDLSDKALQVLKLEGERQKSRFPFGLRGSRSDIPGTVKAPSFDIAPNLF